MRHPTWSVVIVLSALLVAGCAARQPVLYPNAQLERVGRAQADRDIAECGRLADGAVSSHHGTDIARDTAVGGGTGAAVGAAVGAAGGHAYGGAGRGAAAGAAGGATAAFLRGLFRSREPSAGYTSYVNACLADRGYRVVSWE